MTKKKETFCCPGMEYALKDKFIFKYATTYDRGCYIVRKDLETADISYCPFCGASLDE
jgi:hypothetical protein